MAYDPFFSTNPVVAAMETHRGKVEQVRENTARLASAYATYSTEGDGEFLLAEAHSFGCTFTEQPVVAYGFHMTGEDDQLVVGKLPQASGGVRKWVKDARGYFTGAYVFFTVNTKKVEQTTPNPGETAPPAPAPTEPPTPASTTFTDDFDRPDSGIVGNGWTQAGGDFYINTGRAITRDASSYMGQNFGRKNLSVEAPLRTPDTTMQPCVYAWSNSTAGGTLGYCFAFGRGTGTNATLRRSGTQVAATHVGAAGTAIGNVTKKLKMTVVENTETNKVKVTCFMDGVQVLTFEEDSSAAPTGSYSGAGNQGDSGANGTVVESFILGQLAAPPTAAEPNPDPVPDVPGEPIPSEPMPVYKISHDFTWTGIALKDLPEYLLDPAADR